MSSKSEPLQIRDFIQSEAYNVEDTEGQTRPTHWAFTVSVL